MRARAGRPTRDDDDDGVDDDGVDDDGVGDDHGGDDHGGDGRAVCVCARARRRRAFGASSQVGYEEEAINRRGTAEKVGRADRSRDDSAARTDRLPSFPTETNRNCRTMACAVKVQPPL